MPPAAAPTAAEASRRAPVQARAAFLRAHIDWRAGRLVAAREGFSRVIRLDPQAHQARLELARLDLEVGDTVSAAEWLEGVLARSPSHAPALDLRARLRESRGDLEGARRDYAAAVAAGADWPTREAQLGLLLRLGREDAARVALRAWVAQPAGSLEEQRVRGMSAAVLMECGAAFQDLGELVRLGRADGQDTQAWLRCADALGHRGEAFDVLEADAQSHPGDAGRQETWVAWARAQGDPLREAAGLAALARVDPHPGHHHRRAALLLGLQDAPGAATALGEAAPLVQDPADRARQERLQVRLLLLEDPAAALAALPTGPAPTGAWLSLRLEVLRQAGRADAAADLLDAAMAAEPGSLTLLDERIGHALAVGADPAPYRERWVALTQPRRPLVAWAWQLHLGGAGERVRTELEAALAENPRDAELVDLLVRDHLSRDEFGPALDLLGTWTPGQAPSYLRAYAQIQSGATGPGLLEARALLEMRPDDPATLNLVGYTLGLLGIELDVAERHLRRALDLSPADPHTMDSLGWLLVRSGRIAEGRAWLQAALARLPGDPAVQAHLDAVPAVAP